MPHTAPKTDAAVPGAERHDFSALVQIEPEVVVLAVSHDPERLRAEARTLHAIGREMGAPPRRLAVQSVILAA